MSNVALDLLVSQVFTSTAAPEAEESKEKQAFARAASAHEKAGGVRLIVPPHATRLTATSGAGPTKSNGRRDTSASLQEKKRKKL